MTRRVIHMKAMLHQFEISPSSDLWIMAAAILGLAMLLAMLVTVLLAF